MLELKRCFQHELGNEDCVMAVDGIVKSNSEISSIVDCGVDIQFPLCSQQLIDLHAHVQFQDFPVVLPHHYISSI